MKHVSVVQGFYNDPSSAGSTALSNFVTAIKDATNSNFRWGAGFNTPDPVHFDNAFNVRQAVLLSWLTMRITSIGQARHGVDMHISNVMSRARSTLIRPDVEKVLWYVVDCWQGLLSISWTGNMILPVHQT